MAAYCQAYDQVTCGLTVKRSGSAPNIMLINQVREYFSLFLAQLAEFSYKLVKMLSVCVDICLDINQGGTHRSHCTQRCECSSQLSVTVHRLLVRARTHIHEYEYQPVSEFIGPGCQKPVRG